MVDFGDNRLVNIKDLEQVVNGEGERVYSQDLIEKIKNGDFNCLNNINLADRNNKYFMEPILFAVKNSKFGTYEVYKYYGEELQKQDLTIATEIVINEPDVMEDTAITNNATLVLYFAQINPEIILYISEDLINKGEFIEELWETGNREAMMYAFEACDIKEVLQENPDLASNAEFMKEAIKEDASILKYVDKSLKNDYEFIRQASMENTEVINYVATHTNEFGKEGLGAAKEVLVQNTTCRAIEEMQSELEKVEIKKAEMEAQVGFKPNSEEYKKIIIRERQLNNNIRFINEIKNGEVKQERAIRIINAVCQDKDEGYRLDLLNYIKIGDAVSEKEKLEKDKTKFEAKDIERLSEHAKLPDVQAEPAAIREEITGEKKQTKENGEIGE